VEGALDVRLPVGDVLTFLAPHLLSGCGAGSCLWWHISVRSSVFGGEVVDRALLLAGLLLAGDRALGALAGARVGPGALTAHRQATAVPDALVATDLYLAADVGLHLTAQVTLDLEVALDEVAQLYDLVVGQVLGSLVGINPGGDEGLRRTRAAH